MTNFKEYTDSHLNSKLDLLMNKDESNEDWLNDCFGNIDEVNNLIESERLEKAIEESRYQTCGKCNGKGKITHYHYVSGGVCFSCDGKGKIYK